MGKIRTRIIGLEEVENKQKKEQKKRSEEKKLKEKLVKKEEQIKEKKPQKEKVEAKKEPVKKVKTRVRGKKYLVALQSVDKKKKYTLEEAIPLLKKIRFGLFEESVELHIQVEKTGLKGEIDLPHATGKIVKVAVVDDHLLANIEKGILDFDILVTHPSFMPKLARFAPTLGPKGLMPNPKAGTISTHPQDVVKKFSKGLLRWKTEPKFPLIHQMVGKISLEEAALVENIRAFLHAVGKASIKKAFLKTTMSPSVELNLEKIFTA